MIIFQLSFSGKMKGGEYVEILSINSQNNNYNEPRNKGDLEENMLQTYIKLTHWDYMYGHTTTNSC